MKYLELIHAAILKKKKTNPQYSNNAFARDIGVSSAFLSNILSGKKEIPLTLLPKLIDRLDFDSFTKNEFLKKFLDHKYKDTLFEEYLGATRRREQDNFLPNLSPTTSILERWYYLAILEYLSCQSYTGSLEEISQRFHLTHDEVFESFFVLEQAGVIEKIETGKFKKCDKFIRISTTETHAIIREFHNQMIEKAQDNLKQKNNGE